MKELKLIPPTDPRVLTAIAPFNEDMLKEAIALKDEFVKHRDEDNGGGGYRHKGWRSLCVHGISSYKTNHYEQYGYKSNDETPYKWTNICA